MRHSLPSFVAEQYKWVRGPVAPVTFVVDDFRIFGRFIFLK
jgi:hypothetical protein